MFKTTALFIVRIVALSIIIFIGYVLASVLLSIAGYGLPGSGDQSAAGQMFMITCILNASIIAMFLSMSSLRGLRLMTTLFLLIFCIQTVMSQIETVYFNSAIGISSHHLIGIIASGGITAIFTSLCGVVLFGKMKPTAETQALRWPSLSLRRWVWVLLSLSLLYVVLYFTFGYFVAWQFAEVREFYTHSTAIQSFTTHMAGVIRNDPWILALQALRGILWTGLVVVVLAAAHGRVWTSALLAGAFLAIILTSQLLIPNPFMPDSVRMAHLVETSTSTFLFGAATAILVKHQSQRTGGDPT